MAVGGGMTWDRGGGGMMGYDRSAEGFVAGGCNGTSPRIRSSSSSFRVIFNG